MTLSTANFRASVTSAATSARSAISKASAATVNAYRLYSPLAIDAYYVAAPVIRDAYSAAQDWIANEAPVIEQRIKVAALKAFVAICQFAIAAIDWLQNDGVKYALVTRSAVAKASAKASEFVVRHGIDTKFAAFLVAARKLATYTAIADRLFCLK